MADTSWFEDARFGLFVHWGPWARAGWEASWPLVGGVVTLPLCQDIPAEHYHEGSDAWRPDPAAPERWVRAARAAGMRYAVLTARHHDGFALWPSAAAPFGVGPDGPDIVGAFTAACREAGLKAGLYLSLSDWRHPDYPPFTDAMRPYRFGAYPLPPPDAWERYRTSLRGQIAELLARYQPDLLWFDGGWERSAAQWDADGLAAFIRARAPGILLNDRLPGHGDFATPEQFVPAEPLPGPWESCLTMNRSWGFNAADQEYKSATQLIHTLAETAARGGNLLLNIGPHGDGAIAAPQAERLAVIGDWMASNGAAIIGTRAGLAAWQCPAPTTRRGSTVYVHLLMQPVAPVPLRGVPVRHVASVRHLASGTDLAFETRVPVLDELMGVDGPGELLIDVPRHLLDAHATAIAVTFACPPDRLG